MSRYFRHPMYFTNFRPFPGGLKLEINKPLQFPRGDLEQDKHQHGGNGRHDGHGQVGEPGAVFLFERFRQPVEYKARQSHEKNVFIGPYDVEKQTRAEVVHHLVDDGFGGVQVGAAEKDAREADEHVRGADTPDADGGIVPVPEGADFFPAFVHHEPQAVQTAPDDEHPARAVPEAADEHGDHHVDFGGDEVTQLLEPVAAQQVGEQGQRRKQGQQQHAGEYRHVARLQLPAPAVEGHFGQRCQDDDRVQRHAHAGLFGVQVGFVAVRDQADKGHDGKQQETEHARIVVQRKMVRETGLEIGIGEHAHERADEHQPKERTAGGGAVAAERDVQVIAQPGGERNVPAAPEIAHVLCLVRRVEVLREVEAHQQRHARGHVGIPRKIAVYLQRIGEDGQQVLDARVHRGVGVDAVDKIDGDIVAHEQFFCKPVQYPEHADTELLAAEGIRFVDLGQEMGRPGDGTREHLREKGNIKPVVDEAAHRLQLAFVHFHRIADGLEGVERDTDGQDDLVDAEPVVSRKIIPEHGQPVHHLQVAVEQAVIAFGKEIGVLEIAEDAEVHGHGNHHQYLAQPFVAAAVHPQRDEIVHVYGEQQQQKKQAAGLVVEENAHEEHEQAAQRLFVIEKGIHGQHDRKENPERKFGEDERRLLVEQHELPREIVCIQHYAQQKHREGGRGLFGVNEPVGAQEGGVCRP